MFFETLKKGKSLNFRGAKVQDCLIKPAIFVKRIYEIHTYGQPPCIKNHSGGYLTGLNNPCKGGFQKRIIN